MPTFGIDALSPWFAAAGTIPIVIHLLNRQQYRRVRWAAMEFLLAALKKVRRRLQFENLILLLVRVLILALLALALARPTFQHAPIRALATSDTHVVIAIDNSYSMGLQQGGKTPYEKAQEIARELVRGVAPKEGDKVTVIAMNDHPSFLIGKDPSDQVDTAEKYVADLALSDYGTSVPKTVTLVQEALKNGHNSRKKVYLLTDMQRSSWMPEDVDLKLIREQLAALTKDEHTEVTLVDVGVDGAQNVGVAGITPSERVIGTERPVTFWVRFRNFGTSQRDALPYNFIVDGSKEPRTVSLGAGGNVDDACVFQFREPGAHTVEIEVEGDPLPGDNRHYFAVNVRDHLSVLLVDGEGGEGFEDEVVYLKYALAPTEDESERMSIYKVESIGESTFNDPAFDVRKYDLVILANVAAFRDQKVQNLEQFVAAGGGLLIFLGDHVERLSYNDQLWRDGKGLLPGKLTEVLGDDVNEFGLEKVDFAHPIVSAQFAAHSQLLGQLKANHWYGCEPDESMPDTKVVARFDDPASSPAIVEKQFQRGKTLLVTTTADAEWNRWVGFQAYVILADQAAMYLASQALGARNVTVGEPIVLRLRQDEYRKDFVLSLPERRGAGRTTISPPPPDPKATDQAFYLSYGTKGETDCAGFYSIYRAAQTGTGEELFAHFAANVDAREGDLSRIGEEELKEQFPGFEFVYTSDSLSDGGRAAIKPPPSGIWKVLAWTVFVFLFLETLMAAWFGRAK